jgi:hypothetical protein
MAVYGRRVSLSDEITNRFPLIGFGCLHRHAAQVVIRVWSRDRHSRFPRISSLAIFIVCWRQGRCKKCRSPVILHFHAICFVVLFQNTGTRTVSITDCNIYRLLEHNFLQHGCFHDHQEKCISTLLCNCSVIDYGS